MRASGLSREDKELELPEEWPPVEGEVFAGSKIVLAPVNGQSCVRVMVWVRDYALGEHHEHARKALCNQIVQPWCQCQFVV